MTKKATATQDSSVAVPPPVSPNEVPVIKVIPGLTLHLPMNKTELQESLHGPLFTLFESCVRSKLKLKLHSSLDEERTRWIVSLFIEDKLISKGISESHEKLKFESDGSPLHCEFLGKAKVLAANKALDILKNCPQRQNTRLESFVRPGETIPGLKLYLDDPCPQRGDCLALLTESCRKCNLPMTWWDDEGCEVFKSFQCITVLLINSKPICYGWGRNLEVSRKETAHKAIFYLMIRHTVVSRQDKEPPSLLGTQSALCGSNEKPGSSLDDTQPVLSDLEKTTNFETTKTVVPGLTMYIKSKVPRSQTLDAAGTINQSAINRSVSRSKLSWKLKDMGSIPRNGRWMYATALFIGSTIVAWSYGLTQPIARKNISWAGALTSLLKTQPVVYSGHDKKPPSLLDTQSALCGSDENPGSSLEDTQSALCGSDESPGSSLDDIIPAICGLDNKPNFETTNTVVPGLTMYVTSKGPYSQEDAQGTIDRSMVRSKLSWKLKDMGMTLRNGKRMFATALHIGSTIVAWSYGDTKQSSRKNISWGDALASLLKTQHVVSVGSELLSYKYYESTMKEINEIGKKLTEGRGNRAMLQERKRELLSLRNQYWDNIYKGDELYILLSEWVDEDGGVESMVDSDEVIRKYMECL